MLVSAYINVNQPHMRSHICSLPPEPPSHLPLHPTSLGCHRALSWAPCVTADSHLLSVLHMVFMCFHAILSIRPTLNERIQKLWYIYTMECCSAIKKEHIWVSPNEVDEPRAIIQSEISQKEKDKYCILMHAYGILSSFEREKNYHHMCFLKSGARH